MHGRGRSALAFLARFAAPRVRARCPRCAGPAVRPRPTQEGGRCGSAGLRRGASSSISRWRRGRLVVGAGCSCAASKTSAASIPATTKNLLWSPSSPVRATRSQGLASHGMAATAFAIVRERLEAQQGGLGVAFAHQGPAIQVDDGRDGRGAPGAAPRPADEASYRRVAGYSNAGSSPAAGREFGPSMEPGRRRSRWERGLRARHSGRRYSGRDCPCQASTRDRGPRGRRTVRRHRAGPPGHDRPIEQNHRTRYGGDRTAGAPLCHSALRAAMRAADPLSHCSKSRRTRER